MTTTTVKARPTVARINAPTAFVRGLTPGDRSARIKAGDLRPSSGPLAATLSAGRES